MSMLQTLVSDPSTMHALSDQYHAATGMLLAADNNPFSGLKPKWSVLGEEFNSKWVNIVGAVWAMAIAVAGFFLLRGIVSFAQHRGGAHPSQVAESRTEMMHAAMALGGVLMFGIVMGVMVKIFG